MITDIEYTRIKHIRKRHAAKMKEITVAVKKAAKEAIALEQQMIRDVIFSIEKHEGELPATFTSKGPLTGKAEVDSSLHFHDVVTLADKVLSTVKAAQEDMTVIVPKNEQEIYARTKLEIFNFEKIPPNWNPATHYHCGDFRPVTPTNQQKDPSEYETPEGSWVVEEEIDGYLSETGEEVIYVPKAEQAAFARKKYGIKDLSIIPPTWNPSTHYRSGDFRPKTPTFNPMNPALTYEATDGCWIIPAMK